MAAEHECSSRLGGGQTMSGVFLMHSFGICTYASMGFQIINLLISRGPAACGAHLVLVGPTSVQAVKYMYNLSSFTICISLLFSGNKKRLSVPLASRGSLSYGSVSRKVDA